MSRFALVAIGYNRTAGMLRLLRSLASAEYDEPVDLIISLDNCGKPEVKNAIADFEWTHGKKIIRTFSERQGLRKHILLCGDFLHDYDAIAVFEDDIFVSPGFFSYMKQCVEYYSECEDIAGISLYSHKMNVNVNLPFEPEPSVKDVFMVQFAQSWGQVWMKKQWFAFRKWYDENWDKPLESADTPLLICQWPESSWLKYHIKYCIAANKYFVYPYNSLTTCFNDIGEHCEEENIYFQVAVLSSGNKKYNLSMPNDPETVKYDAFFEREGMDAKMKVPAGSVCVDIYGAKGNKEGSRFWLTRKVYPYKIVKSYALTMRPQECNVMNDIAGNDIFLYDTEWPAETGKENRVARNHKTVSYYYNIAVGWKVFADYLVARFKKRLRK